MRLKILIRPTRNIDGVTLDHIVVGGVYELGTQVACVFLAEGWAELDPEQALVRQPRREIANRDPLVLVVDDDAGVRGLTEALLTAHGYRVVLAGHGRDAILRLQESCPNLIILDLNMPVMDGWQFRTEQRYLTDALRAAVPVLLLTAEDDPSTHAETLRAVGVVKKPFDPDDLLEAVSAALGSGGFGPDGIGAIRPWKRSVKPSAK